MTKSVTGYRSVLRDELERRGRKNPAYSQRAFARDLGMRPHRLGEILNGKQGLSAKAAREVATKLRYSPTESERFENLARKEHGRSRAEREAAERRLAELSGRVSYRQLELDSFRILSSWYHFAILELTKLRDFVPSNSWISRAISVPIDEVEEAILRLERVGFLKRERKKWIVLSPNNTLPSGPKSQAVQRFHQRLLLRTARALQEQPTTRRENVAGLFAIPPERLDYVKVRIRDFLESLDREFEKDKQRSRLYCMGIHFFNLTEALDAKENN